jgi:1-acyl-sn-glycerol-3-phosphate acyltransferase
MTVLFNCVRVGVAALWTAIVGTPLLVVIWGRYWYGITRAQLGRRDVLDRVLEGNARLAGWVAQRLWTGVLLALAGIRLRVRELVSVDWAAAHVICANHASLFDILALVRVVPPPFRFVAKRELLRWPFVGWALRPAGQIVIDRADHSRALRSIAEAAVRKIRGQVIFFVEGTRTRTGQLLPFKKGAFHFSLDHCLPVLPTAILGSYSVLAKVPWWRMRTGRAIDVCFCGPIDPSAIDGETPMRVETLLNLTRRQIATLLSGAEAQATVLDGAGLPSRDTALPGPRQPLDLPEDSGVVSSRTGSATDK